MTQEPTSTGAPHHDPTVCYCCGRRAIALGIGTYGRDGKGEPKYLCQGCWMIVDQIKAIVKWDVYETRAIRATIERVGPTVEANGTDLGAWTEDQVTAFVGEIILTFGDSIREQIRNFEAPF